MDENYCRDCRYYREFYNKSFSCFVKSGFGKCRKDFNVVKPKDSCENWVDNEQIRKSRIRNSKAKLDEALTSIIELKQILKEELE